MCSGWLQRESREATAAGSVGWRPWYWSEGYASGVLLYFDSQSRCALGCATGALSLPACVAGAHASKPNTLQVARKTTNVYNNKRKQV